ncbi:MAG: pyruvate kinase [Bacteroidetes bacterium]|nr:pyruvate kinase [Bacteroidota bacterium]MDA1119037.1 pyruvate kinase [Bacteroidota bacterium]
MKPTILFNKTKIVATIGPASNSKEVLSDLIKTGVDVFRLNFSHGTHEDHKKVIEKVRELNEELGTHICLLQDLQGPKIRTTLIENDEVIIVPGQKLTITTKDITGNSETIGTTYKNLPSDVKVGDSILVDDGKIELLVESTTSDSVVTTVIHGGPLKSRKGINLPNTRVSAPSLTDKDELDLQFGLANDVEWIALSFVRTADDIHRLREKIKAAGKDTKIIAKIEKPEALKNIDEIIDATDGLMVARGDLGVEIAMEDVPVAQKLLVKKCNQKGKPVIIATQMMESMIENPRPTRAETNDVANAVMDGADAMMLSAESASGKFPVESVKSMARTILSVEQAAESIYNKNYKVTEDSESFVHDTLVRAACRLSDAVNATAIIGMTQSGYTGFRIAMNRPKADIFIFTRNTRLLRQMNIVWGIRGFYYDKEESVDETFEQTEKILGEEGHLHSGDIIINTAAMPLHWKSKTNMLKIKVVD